MESSPAILLRRAKLTESSLIVSWFSEAHGRVRTVAKGGRDPKNRMAGALDLFFECQICFVRSRSSDLHALREAHLVPGTAPRSYDYPRLSLAAYFTELLELFTEPEHAAPELYDLLRRALRHLDRAPASARALLHFEAELARLTGIDDPRVSPSVALGRVSHRLPPGRAALLRGFEGLTP